MRAIREVDDPLQVRIAQRRDDYQVELLAAERDFGHFGRCRRDVVAGILQNSAPAFTNSLVVFYAENFSPAIHRKIPVAIAPPEFTSMPSHCVKQARSGSV